jgi:hypothetical protein
VIRTTQSYDWALGAGFDKTVILGRVHVEARCSKCTPTKVRGIPRHAPGCPNHVPVSPFQIKPPR